MELSSASNEKAGFCVGSGTQAKKYGHRCGLTKGMKIYPRYHKNGLPKHLQKNNSARLKAVSNNYLD